jgi:hypothetical protein
LNIHHITRRPNALHTLNLQVIINLYIAPSTQEAFWQVLGVRNHTNCREIQISYHFLTRRKGEFGGASVREFIFDFGAVDDFDAEVSEL